MGGGIHEVQAEARRVFCLFHREGSFRLHIQMLADGEHAAQRTHQRTTGQTVRQDGGPDGIHRHHGGAHEQLPQPAQRAGGLHDVGIAEDTGYRGDGTRDQAHGQALHKKGQGDKVVGRAHILHDLDLTAAGKNAQADGAAHRDDADRHQHQDHDLAHLGHGPLDLHKGLGHLNGGR